MIVIATLLSLALVELVAWVWVKTARDQQLSRWEFRATQPPPYQNADYFSERFLKESETFVNGRLRDVVQLDDYRGEYFNVIDGIVSKEISASLMYYFTANHLESFRIQKKQIVTFST